MIVRKPWVAVLLSFLMWGGGHLYVGRAARFFVAVLLFILVWYLLALGSFLPTFIGYIIALISTILFGLFCLIDPIILARRTPFPEQLFYMNKWMLFAYFIFCVLLTKMLCSYINPDFRANVLGFDFQHMMSSSMAPTILKGDLVLTDTRAYRQNGPAVGDVVLVRHAGKDYIRLVRSVSGDSLWVSTSTSLNWNGTNPDLLVNVEIPSLAVKGRLTYVVFSWDLQRIGSKITELNQSTPSGLSFVK